MAYEPDMKLIPYHWMEDVKLTNLCCTSLVGLSEFRILSFVRVPNRPLPVPLPPPAIFHPLMRTEQHRGRTRYRNMTTERAIEQSGFSLVLPISLRAYPSLRRYISLNERSLLFFPWAFYFSPSYVIQFRFSVLFRIIYLFRPLKFGGKSCEARLHHECRSASVMHMTGFMSNW